MKEECNMKTSRDCQKVLGKEKVFWVENTAKYI